MRKALSVLEHDAIVSLDGDSYRVQASTFSMLGDDRERRLASLHQFLQALADVLYQRFFALDGSEAFARVLSFRSAPGELENIGHDCYSALREQVFEADARQRSCAGTGEARSCSVALFYSEAPKAPAMRR